MTENPGASSPAPESGTFFGNLFNLYFEPGDTFAKIFAKPKILLAILLQTALGLGFTSIWLAKVDTREFMRQQIEQNPRIQQMPAEQVDRIIDMQSKAMRTWGRFAPAVAPALIDLFVASILLFIFRFFMAADVTFRQSLATVAWTLTAIGLVQTPTMLAVFALKEDWNLDPNSIIQANPTILFERADLPGWLWTFLSSLDLFSFWTMFLLATGYSVAAKRGLGTGVLGVAVPWLLFVAMKVGFRLIFG